MRIINAAIIIIIIIIRAPGGGGGHSAHILVGMCHGNVKTVGLWSGSSVKMWVSGAGSSVKLVVSGADL